MDSNQVTTTDQNNGLSLISEDSLTRFNEIQGKITELQKLASNEMSQMAVAAAKANIIAELKKALPKELVESIKKNLENNRLGFKTDKEGGYDVETVRTALIESAVDGFYWHGNEFNIIGGNAYYTKEGFTNKIKRTSEFTNLIIEFGIPDYDLENKRAIIHAKASWTYHKKQMDLERDFSVKLTIDKYGKNWTTDDAIIGKAERKVKAKIWEISTGTYLPEADADEISEETKFNNAEDVSATIEEEEEGEQQEEQPQTEPVEDTPPEKLEVEKAEFVKDDKKPVQTDWEDPDSIVEAIKRLVNEKDSSQANIRRLVDFKKAHKVKLSVFSGSDYVKIKKALTETENVMLKIK